MSKISELTIVELDSYLNVIQKLTDRVVHEAKISGIDSNMYTTQKKLDKLNKCRNLIIREIDSRLDETFLQED